MFAHRVPAQKLKMVVAVIAICAGLQLVWTGARALGAKDFPNTARFAASASRAVRP
jgi:hypothetical protein